MLDRILRALGLNPVQVRWKVRALLERWRRVMRSSENRSRALSYQHKLCPECGLNVDADEQACPRCGRRLSGLLGDRLRRLWHVLAPGKAAIYSMLFVAVNVVFYLAMMMRSGGTAALGRSIETHVIVRFGAWTVPLVAEGQLWRLVTPIFLHFNLLHLIFNCLWLIQLGPLLEEHYGRSRYLALYLTSGIAGFVATVAYRWEALRLVHVPGAGASGVVFGLIGAALVAGYVRRSAGSTGFREGLLRWALYGLVFSLLPQVDLVAHLGGGAGGALLALVLADQSQARRVPDRVWAALELFCLVVILACFALVVIYPLHLPPPAEAAW